MARSHVTLLVAVLPFVLAPSSTRADSDCPESCIQSFCSTAAAFDTTYGDASGAYDLVAGTVWADACGGGSVSVVAADRFRLAGPLPGLLIFEARLHYSFSTYVPDAPYLSAEISEGTHSSSTGLVGGSQSGVLTIPIAKIDGEEFVVSYSVTSSAGFVCANAFGTLEFAGLPPAVSVISCQGFRQDTPVQSRSETWGRVKARYR